MQWPKATTSNSWGCGGTVSSAGLQGKGLVGGPGGQAPVSSENPAFKKLKRGQKPIILLHQQI